jgi:hypothetical protein
MSSLMFAMTCLENNYLPETIKRNVSHVSKLNTSCVGFLQRVFVQVGVEEGGVHDRDAGHPAQNVVSRVVFGAFALATARRKFVPHLLAHHTNFVNYESRVALIFSWKAANSELNHLLGVLQICSVGASGIDDAR